MEPLFLLFTILLAIRISMKVLGLAIYKILSIRLSINRTILATRGLPLLSKGTFAYFWLSIYAVGGLLLATPNFTTMSLHPFLMSLQPTHIAMILIVFLMVISLFWIARCKFSFRAILTIAIVFICAPLIVVAQGLSLVMNLIVLFTTSPRYRGTVHYFPLIPS